MPRNRKAAPSKPVVNLETVPLTAPTLPKVALHEALLASGATFDEAMRFVELCGIVTVRAVLEAMPDHEAAAILAQALFLPVYDRHNQVGRLHQEASDYVVHCVDRNWEINLRVVKLLNLLRFILFDRERAAAAASARVTSPRRMPDEGVGTKVA